MKRVAPIPDTQVNEGIGSASGVDVVVGHVINEDKGAGPVQLHRLLVVHPYPSHSCARKQECVRTYRPVLC
jgi:hypothetical protein